jgi:hypothetical protein
MLTILSCDCGHRFEVNVRDGSQVPCPVCGHLLDLPTEAPVTLSTSKYLPQRSSRSSAGRTAYTGANACSDCGGTGLCPICRGRGYFLGAGFLRTVGTITLYVLFGFWAMLIRHAFDVPGNLSTLGPGGCLKCNGRGNCYRCKGTGQLFG